MLPILGGALMTSWVWFLLPTVLADEPDLPGVVDESGRTLTSAPAVPEAFASAPGPQDYLRTKGKHGWRQTLKTWIPEHQPRYDPAEHGPPTAEILFHASELWEKKGALQDRVGLSGATVRVLTSDGRQLGELTLRRGGGGRVALPCLPGEVAWAAVIDAETGRPSSPVIEVPIEGAACTWSEQKTEFDASLRGGLLDRAWELHERLGRHAGNPERLEQLCQALDAFPDSPDAQSLWMRLQRKDACPDAAGRARFLAAGLETPDDWKAALARLWKDKAGAEDVRPYCEALNVELEGLSTEERAVLLTKAVGSFAHDLQQRLPELEGCFTPGFLALSVETHDRACAAWRDGVLDEDDPVARFWITQLAAKAQWPAAEGSIPRSFSESFFEPYSMRIASSGQPLLVKADPDLRWVTELRGDARARAELALCADIAALWTCENCFWQSEAAREQGFEPSRVNLHNSFLLERLAASASSSCARECARTTLRNHREDLLAQGRAVRDYQDREALELLRQLAGELVAHGKRHDLPTYPGLHEGAEWELLVGSAQRRLLEQFQEGCLRGRIEAEECSRVARAMFDGDSWDVPLPGWVVDAPEHIGRYCRQTLRPMLVPGSVSAVRMADIERAGEVLYETGDDEITRLWPRVRGEIPALVAEDICEDMGNLSLGWLATTCSEERMERSAQHCWLSMEQCVEQVAGWCR